MAKNISPLIILWSQFSLFSYIDFSLQNNHVYCIPGPEQNIKLVIQLQGFVPRYKSLEASSYASRTLQFNYPVFFYSIKNHSTAVELPLHMTVLLLTSL